jgi:hypothetical protein
MIHSWHSVCMSLRRMNEQELCMRSAGSDLEKAPPQSSGRPLRICVVFDEDESAFDAEILIRRAASDYECDRQWFRFAELDRPAPVMPAARSASHADILVLTVRDDQMLPSHVKTWLGLCIGLRDEDQEGALVVLIAAAARSSGPESPLLEYLETLAVIGRMAFFPRRRSLGDQLSPGGELLKPEEMRCGSSD